MKPKLLLFIHVISKTSTVRYVNSAMGIIHEVFSVFSASPRRHSVFDLHLGCNLGSPCQTRCIEQHDSVLHFK
jgi:hypothetical protein